MRQISTGVPRGLLWNGMRTGAGARGYLRAATNCIITADGTISPRWGLETTTSSNSYSRLIYDTVNSQMLGLGGLTTVYQGLDKLNASTATWSALDTSFRFSAGVTSRSHMYLLGSSGLRRINSGNTATEIAYVPEGLDIQASLSAAGSGWFVPDRQVAYRIVWGIKSSQNEYFVGAPSGRVVVVNPTAGANDTVTLVITRHTDITTSHFFQVYRTRPSSGDDIDPGDEMSLVYEAFASGSGSGTETFVDYVPVDAGGASLYTNSTQDGLAQGNYPCEAVANTTDGSGDLAVFADCVWASNYQPRSTLTVNLLSVLTTTGLNARSTTANTNSNTTLTAVASFTGVAVGMRIEGTDIPAGTTITAFDSGAGTITLSQAATGTTVGVTITMGDIITIGGVAYIAWTSEVIASGKFLVSTSASASRAVRETSESFVRVFNRYTSTTLFYAEYLSGDADLPGKIKITGRSTKRDSTSTAQAGSHGAAWSPNLTTAHTILSKRERGLLSYSRPNEPQAWPVLNTFAFPENTVITALSALRSALMVWTNKGLYRVTGVYGNFTVDLVDRTCESMIGSSSIGSLATVLDNYSYCLTTKGIVQASEAWAKVVSGPVRYQVENLSANSSTFLGRIYSMESDKLLFFGTSVSTTMLVYNAEVDAWTSWTRGSRCGGYDPTRKELLFYSTTGNAVVRSRSPLSKAFFTFDTSSSCTISAVNETTGLVSFSAAPSFTMAPGDAIFDGSFYRTVVALGAGTDVIVGNAVGLPLISTVAVQGFDVRVEFCPVGEPGLLADKRLLYTQVLFDLVDESSSLPSTTGAMSVSGYEYAYVVASTSVSSNLDTATRDTDTSYTKVSPYGTVMRFMVPTDAVRCTSFMVGVVWRACQHALKLVRISVDSEDAGTKSK